MIVCDVCGIFHPQSYQSYECCQDCCQRLLCQGVLLLLEKQINVGIEVSFPLCSHQPNESWLSYVQCLLDLNEVGSWRVHVGDSMLSSVWSRRICRKENKWTFLILRQNTTRLSRIQLLGLSWGWVFKLWKPNIRHKKLLKIEFAFNLISCFHAFSISFYSQQTLFDLQSSQRWPIQPTANHYPQISITIARIIEKSYLGQVDSRPNHHQFFVHWSICGYKTC